MVKKISYVDLGLSISCDELKKIIIDKWQSGKLYKYNYSLGYRGESLYENILHDLMCCAEDLGYDIEKKALDDFGLCRDQLVGGSQYQKTDTQSVGWEVFGLLSFSGLKPIEELTTDDIPMILEFLDTPADKLEEAWDKWEKYWENLDYPARRRKLLENAEK